MGHKGRTIIIAAVTAAVLLAVPSVSLSQATGDTGELQYPRNNVKGGALGARSPGNWLNRAAGTHIERQTTMLHDFGGAEPISEDQVANPRREAIIVALEGVFDFLIQLVEQYQLAIEASRLASSTS